MAIPDWAQAAPDWAAAPTGQDESVPDWAQPPTQSGGPTFLRSDNLPAEDRNLTSIIERHLQEGAAQGVYPKAIPATPFDVEADLRSRANEAAAVKPEPTFFQDATNPIRDRFNAAVKGETEEGRKALGLDPNRPATPAEIAGAWRNVIPFVSQATTAPYTMAARMIAGDAANKALASPEQASQFFRVSPSGVSPDVLPEASKVVPETQWYKDFRNSLGERTSSMTSPEGIAQLASFINNPVALNTFIAQVAQDTPQNAQKIIDTANKFGWNSPQTAAEVAVIAPQYLPMLHAGKGLLPSAPEKITAETRPDLEPIAPDETPRVRPDLTSPEWLQQIKDSLKPQGPALSPELPAPSGDLESAVQKALRRAQPQQPLQTQSDIVSRRLAEKDQQPVQEGEPPRIVSLVKADKPQDPVTSPTLNIGLNTNDGGYRAVSRSKALYEMRKLGMDFTEVHDVETGNPGDEPTLVVKLKADVDPGDIHELSEKLGQEAIAYNDGEGHLRTFGPGAGKWEPNPEYFKVTGNGIKDYTTLDKLPQPNTVPAGAVEIQPARDTEGVSTPVAKPAAAPSDATGKAPEATPVAEGGAEVEGASESGVTLTNASTDAGREAHGLPPAKEVIRREFGESAAMADRQEAKSPGYGRRLVDRYSKGSPKAASDVEHAALLNQLDQAQGEFEQAVKAVNDSPGDTEAQRSLEVARDRLQATYTAAENAGTGTARGLSSRKAIKARQWSHANLEARFRAEVNNGAPLSAEQAAKVADISVRIANADKVIGPETSYGAGLTREDIAKTIELAGRAGLRDPKLWDLGRGAEPHITAADPEARNTNIAIPVGASLEEIKAIRAGKAAEMSAKTMDELRAARGQTEKAVSAAKERLSSGTKDKFQSSFRQRFPDSDAQFDQTGRIWSPTVRGMIREAASADARGERMPADWHQRFDAAVRKNLPWEQSVATPNESNLPSLDQIKRAIGEKGRGKVGTLQDVAKPGDKITVRQDVPAWSQHGVGVVTVQHASGTHYEPIVRLTNPDIGPSEAMQRQAMKIGSGGQKTPHVLIKGEYAADQSIPKDIKDWTQAGYNPDRHSFYYDRATGKPIDGASEALQIGNTVFFKNAKFGDSSTRFYAGIDPEEAEQLAGRVGIQDHAERARKTVASAPADIGVTSTDNVLGNTGSIKSVTKTLRKFLPKELLTADNRQLIDHGIQFFKRNLLKAGQAALKEDFATHAADQYRGYNIYSHTLADTYDHDPVQIMAAETGLSGNASPNNSFSSTERILKIFKSDEAMAHKFDEKMADALRDFTIPSDWTVEKVMRKKAEVEALVEDMRGKKYSEMPADTDHKGYWIKGYDKAYNPDKYQRVVRPDGTLGDYERAPSGKAKKFSWNTMDMVMKGVNALEGKPVTDVLDSAKYSNYFMSKLKAFEDSDHVVVDTHHGSAAYGSSLEGSSPEIKPVMGTSRLANGEFGGLYSLIHEATVQAAREMKMNPKEFQALVWTYQRSLRSPSAFGKGARAAEAISKIQDLWKQTRQGKLSEEQAYDQSLKTATDFHGGKFPEPDITRRPDLERVEAPRNPRNKGKLAPVSRVSDATDTGARGGTSGPYQTRFSAGVDPEEAKKLAKSIGLLKKDTADYEARTKARDTSPRRPARELIMSDEKARALYDRERAKADYNAMLEDEKYKQQPAVVRGGRWLASRPRAIAVAGHGIVFPVTHAGDLVLNPMHWNTFRKGFLRTYGASFNPDFHAKVMGRMLDDSMKFHSDLARRSGLDIGMDQRGAGLVKGAGSAARAWDALKVMRYELWKKQVQKYIKPGMTEAEKLDVGKQMATWANHATGSGKGAIASKLNSVFFGPKLTQSKINRLIYDPIQTGKTFANWKNASLGERAVAMTRLKGLTSYATTLAGFLIANQVALSALGSKQKINFTDPEKGDLWAFKVLGTDITIPGMHTELRALARLLASAYKGTLNKDKIKEIGGDYALNKLSPGAQAVQDALTRQDFRGRPLPFSDQPYGTNKWNKPAKYLPRYSWTEYASTKLPIPLTGPVKYVYDQMREKGMAATDALKSVQALVITGLGLTGVHAHEDYDHPKAEKPTRKVGY